MTILIGPREARKSFANLVERVGRGGEVLIVERSGKPMAAMIPLEMYEQLVAEREIRFQVLDRVRRHFPDAPEREIEQDVSQAILDVRANDVARRP